METLPEVLPIVNESPISLSPPPELRKSPASKIDYLYEVSYSEDSKISKTHLPLINPYSAFAKPSSFSPIRSIKHLIRHTPHSVKEYVQSSKFDQHHILATPQEQFVTLQIPQEFSLQWAQQGFTHLHFGAIRLALSFHGRKGLPVVARIALLDTHFLDYQHACIGTIQTTLNAGTVFVTLFPNFNMALADPSLLTALKVQLQITGAPQTPDEEDRLLREFKKSKDGSDSSDSNDANYHPDSDRRRM